jgi:long-chain acyl-CoA synthetase
MSFICAEMVNMPEEEIKKYDLSSLRLCLSGGAPIPKDILHRFKDRFGLDIILGHGMMEILGWNTAQPLDGSGKLGSVGKVQWGKELKIVDEAGKTLPPNHTGEIIISAPSMMMTGYYNRPRATAEVIREGWLYTGDIGYLDEDGYLFISGRKKEMLTVARKMIAPVDIEEVLYSHPKVAEAAIVGISETTGEAIRAVIVLKKGEEATSAEMEQFCREHLADYQMPKEFVFRESLPRNPMGKVRREELKK